MVVIDICRKKIFAGGVERLKQSLMMGLGSYPNIRQDSRRGSGTSNYLRACMMLGAAIFGAIRGIIIAAAEPTTLVRRYYPWTEIMNRKRHPRRLEYMYHYIELSFGDGLILIRNETYSLLVSPAVSPPFFLSLIKPS